MQPIQSILGFSLVQSESREMCPFFPPKKQVCWGSVLRQNGHGEIFSRSTPKPKMLVGFVIDACASWLSVHAHERFGIAVSGPSAQV
jgi:hypothetical protein